MEIFLSEQEYSYNNKHDFIIVPSPKNVFDIDTDNIEEFYSSFFKRINQFPLFLTYEWYDDDYEGMKRQLESLGVRYSHQFIPQRTAFRMTEQGKVFFDILIFSALVYNVNQLAKIISTSLIPYHLFIISNQNNVELGEQFDMEDKLKITMNEQSTVCIMQYDVPSTYLISNQFKSVYEVSKLLPGNIVIANEE